MPDSYSPVYVEASWYAWWEKEVSKYWNKSFDLKFLQQLEHDNLCRMFGEHLKILSIGYHL